MSTDTLNLTGTDARIAVLRELKSILDEGKIVKHGLSNRAVFCKGIADAWLYLRGGRWSDEAYVDLVHTLRVNGFRSVADADQTCDVEALIDLIDECIAELEST